MPSSEAMGKPEEVKLTAVRKRASSKPKQAVVIMRSEKKKERQGKKP